MNADTTVHLPQVQAFLCKLESLAGENIILPYLLGKKKKLNNFQVPKQFQRTHSVLLEMFSIRPLCM